MLHLGVDSRKTVFLLVELMPTGFSPVNKETVDVCGTVVYSQREIKSKGVISILRQSVVLDMYGRATALMQQPYTARVVT